MAHAAKVNALTDDLITAIIPSNPRVRLLPGFLLINILIPCREMLGNLDIREILP